MRVRRRRTLAVATLLALLVTMVVVWVQDDGDAGDATASAASGTATGRSTPSGTATPDAAQAPTLLGDVAGLGPSTRATVPATTSRAVVVRGDGPQATTASIELYELTDGAWRRAASWRGHLGANGWTDNHHEGDLRTPVGTFTLTDAGGRLADPGTKLAYHRSSKFVPTGTSVFGDSLAGSFDYVIAIDFNRLKGVSPLDSTHPLGNQRGGGIWLHVDHDGPTHGCVSVPRAGMRALLRALSPADHPVVIMGDKARLAV